MSPDKTSYLHCEIVDLGSTIMGDVLGDFAWTLAGAVDCCGLLIECLFGTDLESSSEKILACSSKCSKLETTLFLVQQ